MSAATNQILVQGLNYAIGDVCILHEVDLTVKKGFFVGIIGPNGSGKTSLLSHIYRALPVSDQIVYVGGRELNSLSYRESAQELSVLRQEQDTEFDYTVMELVLMGRAPYRKIYEPETAEDIHITEGCLEAVGLKDLAERTFSNLSGGEKQRVRIARSLAQRTSLLLLDEPTNHLDLYFQWHLMEMIKKLDKTVLAVFHDLNLAAKFCDYLYVMNHGRIIAKGRADEVITASLLKEVFRVDAEIYRKEGKTSIVITNSHHE